MQQSLRDALVGAVGERQVLTGPDRTASYDTDWTGAFTGRSAAVVRPADPDALAGVLRACTAARQPLVLQGGNTGLVGGATPRDGDVVVSLSRCSQLGPLDVSTGEITVGAGATLAQVQHAVRGTGWDVGTDLASRDSASIGGMVATNAGGSRVVAYGSVRDQVAGLQWVLADGTVVDRLQRPRKDNTGYDLVGLLAGSEGTLAAIAAVRLRLVRPPAARAVALLGCGSLREAQDLVGRVGQGRTLAAEFLLADGLDLVCAHLGVSSPLPERSAVAVVLEVGSDRDALTALEPAVGDGVVAAVAVVPADRARLWRFRESHTEALAAQGPVLKLDVAVPPSRLDELVAQVRAAVTGAAPGAQTYVFGHLAEANLHVNVLGATGRREQVTESVLRCVAAAGGSISAEHGVGRAKATWVPLTRSAAEIALLREVKRAWDPGLLLGPGVLMVEPG